MGPNRIGMDAMNSKIKKTGSDFDRSGLDRTLVRGYIYRHFIYLCG